jgi:prepilin-type N-terminal cleavage/methylation domain-containing protein
MRSGADIGRQGKQAFTLIELLVVVAIIALLISILLPSLGQARAQARTTLCNSRIGGLTKCMLLYADDFGETPPFIGVGFEDCDQVKTYASVDPDHDTMWLADQEKWLIPNQTQVWREQNWDALKGTAKEPRVEAGTLFQYTRYPTMYKCPEFERTPIGSPSYNGTASKTQNTFNYSRSVLGRKLLSTVLHDPGAEDEFHPGPIMKVSTIYAPAAMFMMLDEQWDFHCAGNYENPGCLPNMSGMWMCADTIHELAGDMIGSYHGTKNKTIPWPEIWAAQKGSLGYYDGHVDLMTDPWPWRQAEGGALGPLLLKLGQDLSTGLKILDPLLMSIYAQRGVTVDQGFIMQLVAGLGG